MPNNAVGTMETPGAVFTSWIPGHEPLGRVRKTAAVAPRSPKGSTRHHGPASRAFSAGPTARTVRSTYPGSSEWPSASLACSSLLSAWSGKLQLQVLDLNPVPLQPNEYRVFRHLLEVEFRRTC